MTWKAFEEEPGPRPVKASLDRVARRLGAPKAAALELLFDGWSTIVGDAVAAHATPRSLRKGTLVVAVDDPAWATELRFLGPSIVERCQALAGADTVARIDVRVDR